MLTFLLFLGLMMALCFGHRLLVLPIMYALFSDKKVALGLIVWMLYATITYLLLPYVTSQFR